MAQMAQLMLTAEIRRLEVVQPDIGAVLTGRTGGGTPDLSSRSETVTQGAGCPNRARPDLWGEIGHGLPRERPLSRLHQAPSLQPHLPSLAVDKRHLLHDTGRRPISS